MAGLGVFQGESTILVGCGMNDTDGGEEIDVHAGDVIVLPAGTGHCSIQSSKDYRYIGVYPEVLFSASCIVRRSLSLHLGRPQVAQ